tara:strand:+ start:241 stop:444 length:204 start_codon:yes stop_codon:yes gene_type:complete
LKCLSCTASKNIKAILVSLPVIIMALSSLTMIYFYNTVRYNESHVDALQAQLALKDIVLKYGDKKTA